MSLVGSLEDLGLGDILQIVHLSGKSGVLALRSDVGEGQIVFDKGMLRSARARGLPQDLRELIVRCRATPSEALAEAAREARRAGKPLADVLLQRGLLSSAALEELRGQGAADAVLEMFRWRAGEFSFEVREYARGDGDLELATAINPQFLALEGTRQNDELADGEPTLDENEESTDVLASPPLAPGEDPFQEAAAQPSPAVFVASELAQEAAAARAPLVADAQMVATPTHVSAAAGLDPPARPSAPLPVPAERRSEEPAFRQPPPVIVIDPSLPALEWAKSALTGFARIHTFQHTELGIQRIRQYLLRRELPLVLLAAGTPPDPVSGARDVYDVATRLRRQAPRLPIVVVSVAGSRPPQRRRGGAAPTAFAERPKDGALGDARRGAERLEYATALRALVERLPDAPGQRGDAPGRRPDAPAERADAKPAPRAPHVASADLVRLRDASSRLREPARQGDVLSNVLSFAAQTFSRVALFMLREDSLVGIAQIGLGKAGGPDDAALRDVHLPARDSSWVRRVLDTRAPVRGRPVDDGDHRLCVMLGNDSPAEAFVAPLESANRVVAVLYADNLPSRQLLPDTGALELVLHEAGLALDRTLLERSLAEAADGPLRA